MDRMDRNGNCCQVHEPYQNPTEHLSHVHRTQLIMGEVDFRMGKVRGMFHRKWRGLCITKLQARDGVNCTICHGPLDRHIKNLRDSRYITFDHIVPRSKGGLDDLRNLRLAHYGCNQVRGNDPITPENEAAWFAKIGAALLGL
jgi:hypothetical protein